MSCRFFLFFVFILSLSLFHIEKSNIKIQLEKLHLHPQWGPDTYNSPHQRGAVSKAEQPLFVQKNQFKLSKASQSLIRLNIQSLP